MDDYKQSAHLLQRGLKTLNANADQLRALRTSHDHLTADLQRELEKGTLLLNILGSLLADVSVLYLCCGACVSAPRDASADG